MREVLQPEHLFRVSARDRQQGVVPYEPREAGIHTLLVDQLEHLALGRGVGRDLQVIWELELLGGVRADLVDEGRDGIVELTGERRELRLDRADPLDERTCDA